MDPEFRAKKFIKHALDAIEELGQLHPDGVTVLKTYSGKLAHPGIVGGDFQAVLKKIESKSIASFNEGGGSAADGWGSNSLTITVHDWDKFDKYRKELDTDLGRRKNIPQPTISADSDGRGGDGGAGGSRVIVEVGQKGYKTSPKNYWNYVNPLWLIWKLFVLVWRHKIISVVVILISLLTIDYSLAWRNIKSLVNFILNIFK